MEDLYYSERELLRTARSGDLPAVTAQQVEDVLARLARYRNQCRALQEVIGEGVVTRDEARRIFETGEGQC